MTKRALIFCILSISVTLHARWEMNDISILFSLPKNKSEFEMMMHTTGFGKNGVLFPLEKYESVNGLNNMTEDPKGTFSNLTVIS